MIVLPFLWSPLNSLLPWSGVIHFLPPKFVLSPQLQSSHKVVKLIFLTYTTTSSIRDWKLFTYSLTSLVCLKRLKKYLASHWTLQGKNWFISSSFISGQSVIGWREESSTLVLHHSFSQKIYESNANFIRFRYMSHSEILLDIEHEVLYFLGTPSTIEDLRLREFGLPLVSPYPKGLPCYAIWKESR